MFRAKTVKRGNKKSSTVSGPITPASNPISNFVELSGNTIAVVSEKVLVLPVAKQEITTESMLSALLDAESKNAVHRPWLRLERGLRMRLLRAYVEKQKELSVSERVDLLQALVEALDKKLLNSKSQITYNQETGDIVEINALKIIRPAEGKVTYRIEPPNRGTKKAGRKGTESD
jgi:hypothetical protein